MLVAAVLGPEERKDGELEVVRIPPEQLAYAVVLPVGEPEGAMERLVRHAAQGSQSRGTDGASREAAMRPSDRSH